MTKILCLFIGCYVCLHLVWAQLQKYQEKLLIEYSVLARIDRAKEILEDSSFKCERNKFEVKMFVALWDSSEKKIEIVTLNKGFRKIETEQEIEISEVELVGPNAFVAPGHELLAIKRPFGKLIIVYTPYTEAIDQCEVQEEGKRYLDSVIDVAFEYLEEKQVYSKSFSKKKVIEVVPRDLIRNLIIVEHLPFDDSKIIEERIGIVFSILGANRETAYNFTVSEKNAVGITQSVHPTYERIVKLYPEAKLDPDFLSGARNHINAIVAQILLCDANQNYLKIIKKQQGDFELSLVAMYNGGTGKLKKETKEYLKKYGLVKDTIG